MVPESLLKYRSRDGIAVPRFLDERDHPWLSRLITEHERFFGRRKRELARRLLEPFPFVTDPARLKLAILTLDRLLVSRESAGRRPLLLRQLCLTGPVLDNQQREARLRGVAANLGLTPEAVDAELFCDLEQERILEGWEENPSAASLALRANLLLCQGFLYRSSSIRIRLSGESRRIVRHAKLKGLICTTTGDSGSESESELRISGPLALFRHTLLYGRALGELLPLLCWCNQYELLADCVIYGRSVPITLRSGDPIRPASSPLEFDSKLERRFAREFLAGAPQWDLIREPEPVRAGGTLIFPDFQLRHRQDPSRSWWLEIVGFWTPDYIRRKIALIREANLPRLILCIEETRNCADQDLASSAKIIRFRKKIEIREVLAVIE